MTCIRMGFNSCNNILEFKTLQIPDDKNFCLKQKSLLSKSVFESFKIRFNAPMTKDELDCLVCYSKDHCTE